MSRYPAAGSASRCSVSRRGGPATSRIGPATAETEWYISAGSVQAGVGGSVTRPTLGRALRGKDAFAVFGRGHGVGFSVLPAVRAEPLAGCGPYPRATTYRFTPGGERCSD